MNDDYLIFLQKFYDHGLLREVYRTELVIVCNAYNQFYLALDRKFIEKHPQKYAENIPVFTMNSKGLKYLLEDDTFIKRYYINLPEEEQSSTLRFLDEQLFQSLMKRSSVLQQKPIPEHMDLDLEAELLKKGPDGVRARLAMEASTQNPQENPRKSRIFPFFKRK